MHICLGAALSRLEMEIFFNDFVARFSDFEVLDGAEWHPAWTLRRLVQCPIRVQPA